MREGFRPVVWLADGQAQTIWHRNQSNATGMKCASQYQGNFEAVNKVKDNDEQGQRKPTSTPKAGI